MKWQRKKSIVNFPQQLWFALELIAVAIGFNVICAFFLFIPGNEGSQILLNEMIGFVFVKWPMIVLAFVVLGFIGILMSHRLWGPLYGMYRTLDSWNRGKRTARVYFRKYDYLMPAKSLLNTFFDTQQKLIEDAESLAQEIETKIAGGDTTAAKQKAAELTALLQKVEPE